MRKKFTFGFLLLLAILFITTPALAVENGWWWNPDESGRGLAVEIQGNTIFVAWYAYDELTGESMWVSSGGAFDGTNYSGLLLRYRNGQALGEAYTEPDPAETVGSISVQFTGDTTATVSGTINGKEFSTSIQRFRFGCSAPNQNLAGTYVWVSASVLYDDGSMLKTEDGSISAYGTMIISDSTFTQDVVVEGTPVYYSSDYTVGYMVKKDVGFIAFPTHILFIWADGNTLTTMGSYSADVEFTEWDVWRKVDDKTTAKESDGSRSVVPAGGMLGYKK